jgi:hypothetical protein
MRKTAKKRKVHNLEIFFTDEKDILKLAKSEDLNEIVMKESLVAIKDAIKNKSETADIVNITNLNCIVSIKKEDFGKVLDTLVNYYQNKEEYLTCSSIIKLKKKYEKV